jgi:hypothetical protein
MAAISVWGHQHSELPAPSQVPGYMMPDRWKFWRDLNNHTSGPR